MHKTMPGFLGKFMSVCSSYPMSNLSPFELKQ